eukprot:5564898-Lingulodinium_polyedra.AAC.1
MPAAKKKKTTASSTVEVECDAPIMKKPAAQTDSEDVAADQAITISDPGLCAEAVGKTLEEKIVLFRQKVVEQKDK